MVRVLFRAGLWCIVGALCVDPVLLISVEIVQRFERVVGSLIWILNTSFSLLDTHIQLTAAFRFNHGIIDPFLTAVNELVGSRGQLV